MQSLQHLTVDLNTQLLQATSDSAAGVDTVAFGNAFRDFGFAARAAHFPLEDAMAATAGALQRFFDGRGVNANDAETLLAAGVALGAVSRAFHEAPASPSGAPEDAAPLPWLAALHHINQAATASPELATRLETTVRVVAETTQVNACGVYLYDDATDSLALLAAVGLSPSAVGAITVRPGVGITGVAAAEQRVVAAADAKLHPAYRPQAATGEDFYPAQIAIPMRIQNESGRARLVGVLALYSLAPREFSVEEIAFLQTVANELAISIENARLYSRTDARLRRKLAELGTLQRVSHTIASTLDLDDVLRLIAENALELFNAESAAIFRFPNRDRQIHQAPTIAYRVGNAHQLVDELSREEVIQQVLHTGAPRAVDVDYVDGTSRLFCLPLRSARETLGALCLRLPAEIELTEDELGLLQAFSDSATLAIENARLYQEARFGLETASALLQEMHHRVRNNLQTVAALLSLQLRQADAEAWAVHLREAISRVQAIAAVHDLLSDERRLAGTTLDVIAQHVADEAQRTLIPPSLTVNFQIDPSPVIILSRQATVLALIINELVSNAVSHGFAHRAAGTIRISSSLTDDVATMTIANDGERLPANFTPDQSTGLGMRIVQRLAVSDLRGTFTIASSATVTTATLMFPVLTEEPQSSLLPDDVDGRRDPRNGPAAMLEQLAAS